LLSSFPRQFRYVVIGFWNTIFGLVLFTLLMSIIPVRLYLLTLMVSTIIAGMHSYVTQRFFVWNSSQRVKSELKRFLTVFFLQFSVNILVLFALVDYFGFEPLWTQYVVGTLLILTTYFAHKHWTFKDAS